LVQQILRLKLQIYLRHFQALNSNSLKTTI
jgi:hypothetical protein